MNFVEAFELAETKTYNPEDMEKIIELLVAEINDKHDMDSFYREEIGKLTDKIDELEDTIDNLEEALEEENIEVLDYDNDNSY